MYLCERVCARVGTALYCMSVLVSSLAPTRMRHKVFCQTDGGCLVHVPSLLCAVYAACTLCEGACLAAIPRLETLPSNSEPLRVLGAFPTKGSESK